MILPAGVIAAFITVSLHLDLTIALSQTPNTVRLKGLSVFGLSMNTPFFSISIGAAQAWRWVPSITDSLLDMISLCYIILQSAKNIAERLNEFLINQCDAISWALTLKNCSSRRAPICLKEEDHESG